MTRLALLMPSFRQDLRDLGRARPLTMWLGLGFFGLYILAAFAGPMPLTLVMALGLFCCLAVVCFNFPVLVCVVWLLIAGTTPEMWVDGLVPASSGIATTVVKMSGLALVALCILRYGIVWDILNPGCAFVIIFVIGLMHGLFPSLTLGDSFRSLLGSAAPFAFSFSRLSRRWCAAMIEGVIWVPTGVMILGAVLAVAGIHAMMANDVGGSLRLAGSSHPAFLATLCITAVYASLIELYRTGRSRYLWLLALNFVILVASGSRSPLFCAVVITIITFVSLSSPNFTLRRRALPMLLGLLGLPLIVVLAATSSSLRLFTVLSSSNAAELSGRDMIWPSFERAWDQSPLFGWGLGAGKVVIDPDSLLAKLLGTTAAHNEYLRIGVEGGYVGLTLLIGFVALWIWRWSRLLNRVEKIVIRMIMLGFAVECFTDNALIAAPATVLFVWVSALFTRGAAERREDGSAPRNR